MSITKSYNKKTNTYYAYETTYEWSDEKQKKIQRKRCIGQFDPDSGRIIPNGKVGRPSISHPAGKDAPAFPDGSISCGPQPASAEKLNMRIQRVEEAMRVLSAEICSLHEEIRQLPVQGSSES